MSIPRVAKISKGLNVKNKRILITGIAGFIGYNLALKLKSLGHEVFGIDNFNTYYDVTLKETRSDLLWNNGIRSHFCNLLDISNLEKVLKSEKPDVVIHLAAYAGVRHSFVNANHYILNNIVGTQNLIDVCLSLNIEKVIYASTSCVMAGNPLPWKDDQPVGHQLNPYGYTKRTNECQFLCSTIEQTIGLRFFTVYGPYGRPDMALFTFADAAVKGTPIEVYNYGNMKRDFTYVDDITDGIVTVLKTMDTNQKIKEIYNIGRGEQVNLMDFVGEIEKNFDRKLEKIYLPKHPADTQETWSDTTKLQALGWKPKVSIAEGVAKFAEWYKSYYGVN